MHALVGWSAGADPYGHAPAVRGLTRRLPNDHSRVAPDFLPLFCLTRLYRDLSAAFGLGVKFKVALRLHLRFCSFVSVCLRLV